VQQALQLISRLAIFCDTANGPTGSGHWGLPFIDQALMLNPNLAAAWHVSGWIRVISGEPEIALEDLMHAGQLSPFDPLIFRIHAAIGYAMFFAGLYVDAAKWSEKAVHVAPDYLTGIRGAAASYALNGRLDEARKLMAHMRKLDPALRLSNLGDLLPLRRPEDLARYAEALRKAGLPELL
jgi:tetratricopeptide (TPR) repeat protein